MWILRKRSTFEKLNMNQPDAFIDSPFYLLTSIYIRRYIYRSIYIRNILYISCFHTIMRIISKKIINTSEKLLTIYRNDACSVWYTTVKTEHECFVSLCVWRVESIMKRGQYFTITSEQIISEMFLTNYSIHGNIFPWYWVYYAWIDNVFKQSKQRLCTTFAGTAHASGLHETATQVYTSVVPSIDM